MSILQRVDRYRAMLKAKGLQPRYLYLTRADARRVVAAIAPATPKLRDRLFCEICRGQYVLRGMYVHVGVCTAVVGVKR